MDHLDRWAAKSILLVTGRRMYSACGAETKLAELLAGRRVTRVCDFEVNPRSADVRRILAESDDSARYDAIISIGGGSVIDFGKLLKAFWSSSDPVTGFLQGQEPIQPAEIPMVAIPTTAGSGSEATHFAVLYHEGVKHSVSDDTLRPDVVLLIPSLLKSLPRRVAASSGMDALCQGIESYWSIHSTSSSRRIAREAVGLAWRSLHPAILGKEPEALAGLAQASYLAGKAIDITKTTAPHAVSYALTTLHGVAHGHAVGLMVPYFFVYNADVTGDDCLDARGVEWVMARLGELAEILGCTDASGVRSSLLSMLGKLGLESSLTAVGVTSAEELENIVDNGFNPQRVNNNPRLLTREGLRSMLAAMG